ncbi:MAG: hypothetical protein ABSE47_07285 [Acidimicrobiales bacterium]|jgi:hypothetical protein
MWNRRNFRVAYAWRASIAGALAAALMGIGMVASVASPALAGTGTTVSTTTLATPVVSNPSGPGGTPVAGDTATFSVTVTDASGTAVTNPTGLVTIYFGADTTGVTVCQGNLVAGSGTPPLASTASCSAQIPDAGTNNFVAGYPGDSTFLNSLSSVEPITPVDSATSTSVAVTGGTSGLTVGDLISVTANVVATSPEASAAPTGTVAFLDGGSPIHGCSAIALTQGASVSNPSVSAACQFTLTVADNSIAASYAGDVSDGPATVTRPTGFEAALAPSTIAWTAVKTPPVAGDTIKVDATMTGVAGVAPSDAIDVEVAVGTKGPVQLVDCADQPFIGSETVSCTYPVTSAQQLTFSASYGGDNGYLSEHYTPTLSVQPTPATPVVTLTTVYTAPAVGQADTVTATVTGNPVVGAPTGAITVTVSVNSGTPTALTCTAGTPGTDTESVSCPYTYLSADPVVFAATVVADASYVTVNTSIQRSVRALFPGVVVTSPGGSVGATVQVKTVVTGNSSIVSGVDGTITVLVDNSIVIPQANCVITHPLSYTEQSLCSYTYSSVAKVTFEASVAANGAYGAATSSPIIVPPSMGNSTTTLGSFTSKPTIGRLLNLTASVGKPANAIDPIGFVKFFESPGPGKDYLPIASCGPSGEVGLNNEDQAICNVSPVTATETFKAEYVGGTDYKPSTSTVLKPRIHKASVFLYASKKPSASPPVPGSTVTIDVTLTGDLPAGSPTGTVTLHGPKGSNCVHSCTATVKGDGSDKSKAEILVKFPKSGLVTMTVTYAGSSKYLTTANQVSFNVSKGKAVTRGTGTLSGARITTATAGAPARSAARLDRLNSSRRRSSRSIDRTSLS